METLKSDHHGNTYITLAALFIAAASPATSDVESQGALRAIRRKIAGTGIDAHAVADRIRGRETFAPRSHEPPIFAVMSTGVRRIWLDTLALRLRLSDWERRFVADVRLRALSSLPRLTPAQTRTLQKLIDRAWHQGVRP